MSIHERHFLMSANWRRTIFRLSHQRYSHWVLVCTKQSVFQSHGKQLWDCQDVSRNCTLHFICEWTLRNDSF